MSSIKAILTPREIELVKFLCALCGAQWVSVGGVKYKPPRPQKITEKTLDK